MKREWMWYDWGLKCTCGVWLGSCASPICQEESKLHAVCGPRRMRGCRAHLNVTHSLRELPQPIRSRSAHDPLRATKTNVLYTCICVAESLCCPPETLTALLIGCTPIQNKKFNSFKKKEKCVLSHRLFRYTAVQCYFAVLALFCYTTVTKQ